MRPRFARIVPLVLIALLAVPAFAQDAAEQPQVTFKSTEAAPGLYMLENVGGFGGGNVGVLDGPDGVVMIDDSFPPFTETMLAAVAKVASGPADFVINTHVHGDHMGGNEKLSETGATIVAHDNVRLRLVKDGISTGTEFLPAPPGSLPVITFADAMTFHLNGQEAFVFHVEHAHTDGDAVIHFRDADVIHTGDVFFNGVFPFIDFNSGGSLDGYIAAQEKVLAIAGDATRIIPGHGPLASKKDLAASVAMLKDARSRVAKLKAAGKTVEEVIAAAPMAAYEAQSWEFITTEKMIQQVYQGISAE